MNEFIVWDKKSKKFDEDTEYIIDKNGELFFIEDEDTGSGLDCVVFILGADKSKDVFFYICKTDINGKKIYADCSIVEFSDGSKAVMYFCKKTFMYRVAFNGYKQSSLSLFDVKNANIKIIGTLQENPELLHG